MITYRWIDGPTASDEEWERLDLMLVSNSWMALNRDTSRILVAESSDGIIGFCVIQMIPHLEPLYVAPEYRFTNVAVNLADKAVDFMHEIKARGWISIAQHPVAARLCEREGMIQVEHPVYVYARGVTHG